jgi:phage repressor protein C with HTH and peptisase S24 domain
LKERDEFSGSLSCSAPELERDIALRIAALQGDMSVRAFALKCNITDSLMRKYLAGSMPGVDKLVQIAKANDCSVEWLATGEGEKRPRPHANPDSLHATHETEPLVTEIGNHGGGLAVHGSATSLSNEFVLVPRYEVSARGGNGYVIHSEQVVDHLAFKADWVRLELGSSPKNLVLISAVGESMEPTIRPGDLLLVDRGSDGVRQDAIYAISHDGELRIKRVQRLFNGTLIIKSDNPGYQPEELTADESLSLRIVGRVVWSGRRM